MAKNLTVTPDLHPVWGYFLAWSRENNVSLDHSDDWFPWWECYLAGYDRGVGGKSDG